MCFILSVAGSLMTTSLQIYCWM